MRLHLSVSVPADTPVVGVRGEVDALTADDLYGFLATVISQRGPRLDVDLKDVTFMDAAGATALLLARQLATSLGGSLTVIALSAPAARGLGTAIAHQTLRAH
ncbi:STAS domain-containing protein [Nonomuraea jiangxiensis]|uniref:Anti-anti-sigma factor n=1 Tax=Nonomuraea jiangxiensis TaxID=633440 RepID=A0A1G9D6V8_9ACTN|nr:STAS domain-containing protein [Nonomuraea jiangxiensis]SDK59666.1 anti-anti-sigma factor [Nonomuraea jiangxiensis]